MINNDEVPVTNVTKNFMAVCAALRCVLLRSVTVPWIVLWCVELCYVVVR